MTVIVDVVLPFFAMIGAGYAARRLRYVDSAAITGINTFVFYVALPALLVVTLSRSPVERLLDWRFYLVFYGASFTVYGVVLIASRIAGSSLAEAALRALGAAWGNWGFMGIPLLLAAFGPEGAVIAVLAMLGDLLLTSPLTIALVEVGRSGSGGARAALRALMRVAVNPLVVATMLGFALAASGVAPPLGVQRFLELAGAAASPCALFALGGSLVGVAVAADRLETGLVTATRLVLHPCLVWLGGTWLIALPPAAIGPAVLTAALPTATSVFVLAQRYQIYARRASTLVLVTHLVSIVTLSVLLILLAP